MKPLRVLITNFALVDDAGTELYVFDLARRLLGLGHRPVVYTSEPGAIADRLRLATVAVVDDLAALGDWTPDVMHCHHTLETILALLHFPATPAVYACHDSTVWFDQAPPLQRVVRYVAVDETCRDRLELVHGVPGERLRIIPNWVDLARFRPRGPLPGQPERALVFSNYARPNSQVEPVQEACDRAGIPLDVVGLGMGNATSRPEDLLPAYDLVFAKAKAALEAMAVGAAVVLCDARGMGPMVTSGDFDRLRRLNFGARSLQARLDPEEVLAQLKRYDPEDAAIVSARVRAEAGLDATVDTLVELYKEAIAEGARLSPDPVGEGRVLATFLRPVGRRLRKADEVAWRLQALEAERHAWDAERQAREAERQAQETERQELVSGKDLLTVEVDHLRAELLRAGNELAEERSRVEVLQDLADHRATYQVELEALRPVAREAAEEAAALRLELARVAATLTFRLRARALGLPLAGRAMRVLLRVRRR